MRTFIILYALTLNCTRSVRDASINALDTNDPDMQSRGSAMTSHELGPSMAKIESKKKKREPRAAGAGLTGSMAMLWSAPCICMSMAFNGLKQTPLIPIRGLFTIDAKRQVICFASDTESLGSSLL